jgi:hypothetical protein
MSEAMLGKVIALINVENGIPAQEGMAPSWFSASF